ncbi:Rec8 like protein-domain-containing protein [Naematelia encephala]|uniref:Rec8 like protein-domain-containing protein n=1 Tax=Naematelia encephala TaxID=71784 RepID=A0A1Y2AWD8_9TREE|nr:Rec8 like protein-domain-containing protein [Naematelia encephala]
MLLTELILSKRGPLAKVWLSAHHERKLSKQQALGVDVEESVDAILGQEDGPITLRLSGQLMLGVTRIYSRKVQYLLDDCKETRERISLAFRPGIVDLPEDQIRASKNAITFADQPDDFNFFDWSWAAPPPTFASREPIKALRPTTREFGAYNFGRPRASSLYGGGSTASRQGSHDQDGTSHLDSQDFAPIDLGLDLGLDDSLELETGREGQIALSSRAGSEVHRRRDGSSAFDLGSGMGEAGFGGMDLGLFDPDQPDLPVLEARSRRESSGLSTPPPVSPPPGITDLTPRTAARIATQIPRAPPKPKRPRLLQADEELELPDQAGPVDNSLILGEEHFIPANADLLRFQAIIADPDRHFLPTTRVGGETRIYLGPEGIADELRELFEFPANVLRRVRDDDRASKRPRLEGEEDDEEMEVARRASMAPGQEGYDDSHMFPGAGDDTFDLGGLPTDQGAPFHLDETLLVTPRGAAKSARQREREREVSLAPSRAESIARQIQFAGEDEIASHPLGIFDPRTRSEAAESMYTLSTPSKSVTSEQMQGGGGAGSHGGVSKNTGMAMGLLRREIEKIEREQEEKVVSFDSLATKATKRGASAFFFELLVLGTKDMVKLEQNEAFGDIAIAGKDRLFAGITA